MKRVVARALSLLILGCTLMAAPGAVRAAGAHARAGPVFLIGTLTGTAYAPEATGTVRSSGVVDAKLTFVVHLAHVPAPTLLGGNVYKMWLVYPASATVMPGGTLTYNADGTADGTFSSDYQNFTVLAVSAENGPTGAYPQNDKVLEGSINVAALVAALETHPVRLDVVHAPSAAAYHATRQKQHAAQAVGLVTMRARTTTLMIKNAAAAPTSTILITALNNPGSYLWISSRKEGQFTISGSQKLTANVQVQYLILNSPSTNPRSS